MISKKLIQTSLIYTIGSSLPLASGIVLLPFYISYLDSSLYGTLAIYLTFSIFVQVLTVFSFDTSTYLHFHELKNDRTKLHRFISTAFMFILLNGIFISLILFTIGDSVFSLISSGQDEITFSPYGFLAIITGVSQGLLKVYTGLLQSQEKPYHYFILNFLFFFLTVSLSIAGLIYFPQSLIGPMGGRALISFIFACLIVALVIKEYGLHFNFKILAETFSFNFYTFVHQLQQWAINYLDRFFLTFYLSLSIVGIYDLGLKCLVFIDLLLSGLFNSFYPKVVGLITDQEQKGTNTEINRYYNVLIVIIMMTVIASIICLPFVFKFFLTEKNEYAIVVTYLPLIAVLFIVKSVRYYFITPFSIIKWTKPLTVMSFIITFIKILLFVWLIPLLGINGALISSLVAAIAEIILAYVVVKSRFSFRFNLVKLILTPFIFTFLIVLIYFSIATEKQMSFFALIGLVSFLAIWWLYRKEIKLINISKILSIK